eukprot:1388432-Amorphochlora_amoeboformis.AAC.2
MVGLGLLGCSGRRIASIFRLVVCTPRSGIPDFHFRALTAGSGWGVDLDRSWSSVPCREKFQGTFEDGHLSPASDTRTYRAANTAKATRRAVHDGWKASVRGIFGIPDVYTRTRYCLKRFLPWLGCHSQ